MRVSIHLQRVLATYHLDNQGINKKICAATGANATTVRGWRDGTAAAIQFKHLSKLIEFLIRETGKDSTRLIHDLFGTAELWDQIRHSEEVRVHVGEYKRGGPRRFPADMTARCDIEIATNLVKRLAGQPMDIRYVPLELSDESHGTGATVSKKSRTEAKSLFAAMRSEDCKGVCSCIIGSQKGNLLTECLVADCWGLESFKAAPKALRAPFWICYRPGDVHTVSAFGGSEVPKDISDRSRPGIFYRKKREWQCVEYLEGEQDAGVVIITYRAELHSLEIALIGFTGAATAAVGKEFLERPDRFWPPGSKKGDRQIGVYLCKFAKKAGTAKQCYDNCEVQSLDVALTPA